MLLAPGLSSYSFTYDNWGAAPGSTPGTSVIPGASSAEGSWTQLASSANIARDVYWIQVSVSSGATSAQIKNHLLDIGVDDAGGSSYTAVISDIICGQTPVDGAAPLARSFLFPLFIKAGSSVAARVQGSNATAGTVMISIKFYGDPSSPEAVPVGLFSETIGARLNSAGVGFTPGNGVDGTWQLLAATTRDLWWWQLCAQITNATVSSTFVYVDLAYGDASNKVLIQRQKFLTTTGETANDVVKSNLCWLDCYKPVPSGSNIYVRGRGIAAAVTGWNAVAIGIGG